MTNDELDELERVARAAGDAEWEVVDYEGGSLVIHADRENRVCFMATPGDSPGQMARIEARAVHIATFDPPTILSLIAAARPAETRDWSEFEDEISDAISDSIDMDWSSRDGAKAVVAYLKQIGAKLP